MVNNPLIRPATSWGGGIGGVGPLDSHEYSKVSGGRLSGIIKSPNFHQTFQVPKMEVFTYISCMDTAYVREFPHPQK